MKSLASIPLILFLFLLIHDGGVSAQSRELGLFLGASGYKGDLNNHYLNTDFLHPAIGLIFRKNRTKHWSYRISANYGRVSAEDSLSDNLYQRNRNLSFRSQILEVSAGLEFNFFPYSIGSQDYPLTPFVFGGVSGFYFNPKAKFGDDWFKLKPLSTEGQGTNAYADRKPYSLVEPAIMLGGGLKISLSRRIGLIMEMGGRRTYTDYLDDVSTTYVDKSRLRVEREDLSVILSDRSVNPVETPVGKQRGDTKKNDKYMFAGITFAFKLGKINREACENF